ncbi:MAG: hypothetical protein ACRDJP_07700 [Actinomycetota bacterium]
MIVRLLLVAWMMASCADAPGPASGGGDPIPLQEVVDDPGSFDGQRITVTGGYFGAFEVSVLTTGFAESFPPQPIDPLVWVGGSPAGPCLQIAADDGHGESWATRVVATGTFGFEPGGGFGHLGMYEMQLADARIRCA